MLSIYLRLLPAIVLSLARLCASQDNNGTAQSRWITPVLPDFFLTLELGYSMTINWRTELHEAFSIDAPSIDPTKTDLWLTDYDQHEFAHLIAQNVNVHDSSQSTIPWMVNIPSSETAVTDRWMFCFLASGEIFSKTAQKVSSPGFKVAGAGVTTSANNSSNAESTSIFTSGASAPTSTYKSDSSGSGTGTKVGIAVGAVIIGIALVGLGWFLARRRVPKWQPERLPDPSPVYPETADASKYGSNTTISELPTPITRVAPTKSSAPPAELEQPPKQIAELE